MTCKITLEANGTYTVTCKTNYITCRETNLTLSQANKRCWIEQNEAKRYQVLEKSTWGMGKLKWYSVENGVVTPNGFPTIEEACHAMDDFSSVFKGRKIYRYTEHFSIIDTFTGRKVLFRDDEHLRCDSFLSDLR